MKIRSSAQWMSFLVVVLAVCFSFAQENSTPVPVTIDVKDPSGAAVAGASIKISPVPAVTPVDMMSGPNGALTVALTPGTYELTVTQLGFKRWTSQVHVREARDQVINVTLQLGPALLPCSGPCGCGSCESILAPVEARSTINEWLPLTESGPTAAPLFTGQSWWNHVKVLADDKFEGRDTGSRGERKAQEYAIKQLKRAGAKPAGVNGFLQPMKFVSRQIVEKDSSLTLVHDGQRDPLVLGEDAIISTRIMPAPSITAPLAFAGYGLKVPEKNYDDFAGLDLHGKIAVIFSGAPAEIPGALAAHYQTTVERWKALRAAGAVGVISLMNPASMDIPWSRIALNRTHPSMDLDYPEFNETADAQLYATMNPANTEKLFVGSGHTFAEIAALGKERKALPHFPLTVSMEAKTHVDVTHIESANVVAMLPGSDPALKDEYVVLSAHLDHVGIGEPINGDRIYNGAMDDGSGSALVLDMAESFKKHPEKFKRSILLILVTGEEKGLLGSKYFAAHPTVSAKALVADVNADMFLPIVPLRVLTVLGLDESDLGERARAAALAYGVRVEPDPQPERNIFIRSDQYNFIRHGVPAVMMDVGAEDPAERKIFKDWLTQRYHAPSDDVNQPVDLATAAKYEEIVRALLINVADDERRPAWKATSFFRRYADGK